MKNMKISIQLFLKSVVMNNKIIKDNRIKLCIQDSRFVLKRLISDLQLYSLTGQLNYEVDAHLGQQVPKGFAKYSSITDPSFVFFFFFFCHQYR